MSGARDRQRSMALATFMLTLVSAAVLGGIIYLTSTSLPYLAMSPTADPTWGAINACLLREVPQRVGFTVDATHTEAAGWNGEHLAACRIEGTVFTPAVSAVASAAFDRTGHLWALAGQPTHLLFFKSLAPVDLGEVNAIRLVGTATGVITLDPQGELRSIDATGAVLGVAHLPLPWVNDVALSTSGDGERLAAVAQHQAQLFDVSTLRALPHPAGCDVEFLWWLAGGHQALLQCAPTGSLFLTLEADTGDTNSAPAGPRAPSVLSGPQGPWVESCDTLPCTAKPPIPSL